MARKIRVFPGRRGAVANEVPIMVNSRFNRRQVLSTVGASIVASIGLTGQTAASSGSDRPQAYSAELTGDQQVPPVKTDASGHALFEVSEDGTEVSYAIYVDFICNVTQAHIHLGEKGENGPVVAWLYPEDTKEPKLIEDRFEGCLAVGTITEDELVGPLEAASFEEVAEALESEGAYVNIHTKQYPDGEIRGQIAPTEEPKEGEKTEEPPKGDETEDSKEPDEPDDPDDPPEEDGNTVTINVVDLDSGDAVDIPVRITGGDYSETKTASGGTVTFENVPDGEYNVQPEADNWWRQYGDEDALVVEGDTTYTLGVRGELDTYTLSVTVIDAETGTPIEGATVSGVGDRYPSGADILIQGDTNSNGVATIEAPESGYILDASADGYETSTPISLGVDSDTELTIGLEPEDDPSPDD